MKEIQKMMLELLQEIGSETATAKYIGISQSSVNNVRKYAVCGRDVAERIEAAWRRRGLGPPGYVTAAVDFAVASYAVPREFAEKIATECGTKDPLRIVQAILQSHRKIHSK